MAIFSRKKNKEEEKELKDKEKEGPKLKDTKSKSKASSPKKDDKPAKSMKDLYADDKEKAKTKKGKEKINYDQAYRVLIKPLVTEKAGILGEESKYVFMIDNRANKLETIKAIKAVYGVDVRKVNIIRQDGKRVSRGNQKGRRKDWKKAIVSLKKGQTINIYEGV